MQVYGYTRTNSAGGMYGKETDTDLFLSEEDRNAAMYGDYTVTFDMTAENEEFAEKDGKVVDSNGSPQMTEEEFMLELKNSKDVNRAVFGLIQGSDFHIQYEPFCKELTAGA